MQETLFTSPFGHLQLRRRPAVAGLRAWDAADDYLLKQAALLTVARALLINDAFGALTCTLHASAPVSWSDSFVAHRAAVDNWRHNRLEGEFTKLAATSAPTGPFDLVLWRVPKSRALFQQQIVRLHGRLAAGTPVLVGGMDKHLLPDTRQLLQQLGRVDTLPGRRKAHLFRLTPDPTLPAPVEPALAPIEVPKYNLTLCGDANLFARTQLDIGARFFLEQFGRLPAATRVADVGCGNGVLALALAHRQPDAEIHLFDESYQAVAAARHNWRAHIGAARDERFHVADVFSDYRGEPFDLILCNPPFHQQHVVGAHIARQMFEQSRQRLRIGGELWVVANRHLDYPQQLRQLFGNWRAVAADDKFLVQASRRQDRPSRDGGHRESEPEQAGCTTSVQNRHTP